jgi:hypothetical protein
MLGGLACGARTLARVGVRTEAAARTLHIGEKVGVGLRYRLPKTGNKVGMKKEEVATPEQIAEFLAYWRGTCPQLHLYSDAELMEYRDMFRQHATLDKMSLTGFQRFVKQKAKAVGIPSEIMPTLSVELWSLFDEDTGNFIDYGEFVSHYPRMVKALVRYMVRDQTPETFLKNFAEDGNVTEASLQEVVKQYGLEPFPLKDIQVLLHWIAPNNPAAATSEDVHMWAADYTSLSATCLHIK